jgi:EAL domain-containing protein (putative c-di-GMP-specific phosphodiesterase class I)
VHYQPIVDLRTSEVAYEALVRWHHPERGPIAPADFVPVAEETGLIDSLGAWVLRKAVEALANGDLPADAAYVSINISAHQLARGRTVIVQDMAGLLARTGLAADRICIEVTESVLVDAIDGALDVLMQLRELGVRLALDDFGTGYSSLAYLQLLPVDILKIDRSFVCQMVETGRDRAIVAGMLELAHSLGLHVVAEGVESQVQLTQLSALGCDAAQGFYLSPPAPASALEAITYAASVVRPLPSIPA